MTGSLGSSAPTAESQKRSLVKFLLDATEPLARCGNKKTSKPGAVNAVNYETNEKQKFNIFFFTKKFIGIHSRKLGCVNILIQLEGPEKNGTSSKFS